MGLRHVLPVALAALALAAGGCDVVFGLERPPSVTASGWLAVAAGVGHTCGIRNLERTLWCWGDNEQQQLGIGGSASADQPQQLGGATWKAVSSRSTHTCAIREDDTLWCWGANQYGQLGIGDTEITEVPLAVPGTWLAVSAGTDHTCGLRESVTVPV